jgi:hypothetical protein
MPIVRGHKMNELIATEKIPQWEKLKALVLDSVSSPITKRVYNMALNEFMAGRYPVLRRAANGGHGTRAEFVCRSIFIQGYHSKTRPWTIRQDGMPGSSSRT